MRVPVRRWEFRILLEWARRSSELGITLPFMALDAGQKRTQCRDQQSGRDHAHVSNGHRQNCYVKSLCTCVAQPTFRREEWFLSESSPIRIRCMLVLGCYVADNTGVTGMAESGVDPHCPKRGVGQHTPFTAVTVRGVFVDTTKSLLLSFRTGRSRRRLRTWRPRRREIP